MMRTLVVAMMLASASSFAPSPKTQLATRRPAQAAPRVMPAMKLEPGNPLYYIGFPSQYQKDDMIREVCPYHYAPLWNPIASLGLLASLGTGTPLSLRPQFGGAKLGGRGHFLQVPMDVQAMIASKKGTPRGH